MDRERDRLQAVLEALPRAAIVQGGDEHVVAVNRRFVEMFALAGRVAYAPGAPLEPVVDAVLDHFAERPVWIVEGTAAIAARRVHRAAEIALTDGRVIRRDVEPLYDAGGEPFGSLWTAEDITEAKRREHALHRDNAALAELARRRNEFLASASHNLRTPLTSIISFCELLADPASGSLGPDQLAFLEAIRRNATRMATVITTLLDTTMMREPQLRLEFGEVDIARMLEHAVVDRMSTLAEAGLFTVLSCTPGPPLYGDEHRLEHVLDNLLENAAKFTPPGGRVGIAAEAAGDTWRITVADTGIGVPEQYREEIFSGFVRAPNAASGGFPGTGLGLTISRDIVRRHGGELSVAEAPGGGALFTVHLPIAGPTDTGAAGEAP
ncbi:HAMP domain-containing sensor histidine kinase [Streptomyces sp. NPDC020719]|uniref:PAS domain-containing sensor histidine kinase n=1 Tax=Streptomyces sp. NPDC020719 TaxID=3154896 RepID=UPI0033EF5085